MPCRLAAEWEHVVHTYMQRGLGLSSCRVASLRTLYLPIQVLIDGVNTCIQ